MKILNFASMNLDIVYDVHHIVAPGETIASLKRELFCGGKGLNQSIALAKAGAIVYHAGCIGIDGDILQQLLNENGVNTCFVRKVAAPSGHAMIQVDKNGQNSIVLFGGANQMITRKFVDEVLEHFSSEDMVLLQNEINELPYIMNQAWKKGMKIAFNPSPFNHQIVECPLEKVTYFILNEIEGAGIAGTKDVNKILTHMRQNYPKSKIVLTLGCAGSMYDGGNEVLTQNIYKVQPVDTTAAGDTFLGYFLANIERKLPQEALQMAALASAVAVSRKGAANSIPTLKELMEIDLQMMP